MKGHIFNLLEEFIEEVAGIDKLEIIYERCSFDTQVGFTACENYPDEMLLEMVDHTTQVLDISIADAQFAYGKWLFPRLIALLPEQYSKFDHPSPLLALLDNIHKIELKKLYPDATPPAFDYFEVDSTHSTLTYHSTRQMYDLVSGVLQGVAEFYGVPITAKPEMVKGSPANTCVYHLHYGRAYEKA